MSRPLSSSPTYRALLTSLSPALPFRCVGVREGKRQRVWGEGEQREKGREVGEREREGGGRDRKDVVPESYDSATLFFSDIQGFADIAFASTPIQVCVKEGEREGRGGGEREEERGGRERGGEGGQRGAREL